MILFGVLAARNVKYNKSHCRFRKLLLHDQYKNMQFKNGRMLRVGESGFEFSSENNAPRIPLVGVPPLIEWAVQKRILIKVKILSII